MTISSATRLVSGILGRETSYLAHRGVDNVLKNGSSLFKNNTVVPKTNTLKEILPSIMAQGMLSVTPPAVPVTRSNKGGHSKNDNSGYIL